MFKYSDVANLYYWKKRILSLNHPDLTDDTIIIGFNLSPEQRDIMKTKNVIVKLVEETYEQEIGHDQVERSDDFTKYTTLVRKGLTILIQSYKETVKIGTGQMAISNYIAGIAKGIKTKILFSGKNVKCVSDISSPETRTSGEAGMIMHQRKMTFAFNTILKLEIDENNDIDNVFTDVMYGTYNR